MHPGLSCVADAGLPSEKLSLGIVRLKQSPALSMKISSSDAADPVQELPLYEIRSISTCSPNANGKTRNKACFVFPS